jgi:endo-1,4-beta-xylanase
LVGWVRRSIFTETTVVNGRRVQQCRWGKTTPEREVRQADDVAKFYTVVFAYTAVEALTWWDFSDDGAWEGAPAGWLRKTMSPKSVD